MKLLNGNEKRGYLMKYSKEYYLDSYEKLTFARQYEMKVPELLAMIEIGRASCRERV